MIALVGAGVLDGPVRNGQDRSLQVRNDSVHFAVGTFY